MGIAFKVEGVAAREFTFLRGYRPAQPTNPADTAGSFVEPVWHGDSDPATSPESSAGLVEGLHQPGSSSLLALFGLPDCSGSDNPAHVSKPQVEYIRRGLLETAGPLALDLTEHLDSQDSSVGGILRHVGRLCNMDDPLDPEVIVGLLRYGPPLMFVLDLTAVPPRQEGKAGRREWCEALARFLHEHGNAAEGRHAAIVLLPNRHYFDGRSICSYFDRPSVKVGWYRTDPYRPDAAHPQDLRADDYTVRHRTEDADTAQREGTVDRKWIKDNLLNWSQDQGSGTVLLRGAPGTGKSYLQAELFPRWFNQPGDKLVIRGFKAGRGTDSFELVNSLCYELLWQLGCDGRPGESSGEGTTDDLAKLQRWFRRLLEAVAQRHRAYKVPVCRADARRWECLGRLLIGIDALDEGGAEDAAWLTGLIPPHLPKGVYVAVTSRPGLIDALGERETCLRLQLDRSGEQDKASTEGWQRPPDNALGADVKAYLERNLPDVRRGEELTSLVAQAAQDNLLLAALITRQVRAYTSQSPECPRAFIDDIIRAGAESIHQAFGAVFQSFWTTAADKVKKEERRLLRSVLSVLAIAGAPITSRGIQAGTESERPVESLVDALDALVSAGLVERRGVGRDQTFRIPLQRFREYLLEVGLDRYPIDATPYHAAIGKWCASWDDRDSSEADRRYKLRHGLGHLIHAQDWTLVFNTLIGSPDGRNFEYLESRMGADNGAHRLVSDFAELLRELPQYGNEVSAQQRGMLEIFCHTLVREQHTFSDEPSRCFQQVYPQLAWCERDQDAIGNWAVQTAASWAGAWLKVVNEPGRSNSTVTLGPWNHQRVHAIAISPAGSFVAVGVANDCFIYELDTMMPLNSISHPLWVCALCFPSDKSLLTATWAGMCRLIEVSSGRMLDRCDVGRKVDRIVASNDARLVAILDCHGHLHLWQREVSVWMLVPDSELEEKPELISVAFSRDDSRVMAASREGNVYVWDCRTRACVHSVKPQRGHEDLEADIAYSDRHGDDWSPQVSFMPDGKHALCSNVRDECRIVELESGQSHSPLPERCRSPIEAMSVSSNGRRFAAASAEGGCRVWDLHGARLLQILSLPGGHLNQIALSADGTWAVGATSELVHVWRIDPHNDPLCPEREVPVHAVDFSPDGLRIATGLSGGGSHGLSLQIWDSELKTRPMPLKGPRARASIVRFTPSGQRVWAWTADEAIFIWDAGTGQLLRTVDAVSHAYRFYLSTDGRYVVFGGDPNRDKFVFDMMSAPRWVWSGHDTEEDGACDMPEPGNSGRTHRIEGAGYWFLDVESGDLPRLIPEREWPDEPPSLWLDLGDGRAVAEGGQLVDDSWHTEWVWYPAAFYVADIGKNRPTMLFGHRNVPKAVVDSPDGRWGARFFEGRLELYETRELIPERGPLWRHHRTEWSPGENAIAFSPDGSRLAAGLPDGSCRVWDVVSGTLTHAYATGSHVHGIRFSPCGKRLAVVAGERVMLLEIVEAKMR